MKLADGWQVTPLAPGLEVSGSDRMPELPHEIEARVASLWDGACAARPNLFNGIVFCADSIAADRIDGHWTEYRRVLAQILEPALFDPLKIRSLAVTGLLECADGLVLGRREAHSVYQAGIWQSPPAGSVERRAGSAASRIDLAEQLLAECEEELGLSASSVQVRQPVAAIEHPVTHIVDIGFLLRTGLPFAAIERCWKQSGNREYDQLRLLEFGAALRPADQGATEYYPTTEALLLAWREARFANEK